MFPTAVMAARSEGLNLDAICKQLICAFSRGLRAIYLTGSRARGDSIPSSDVDLSLVFAGSFSRSEVRALADRARSICSEAGIVTDVEVIDDQRLKYGITPKTKQNMLLFGEDILDGCPLMSADRLSLVFARHAMRFIRIVRGRPEKLRYPLGYPVPASELRGYEVHGIRTAEGRYLPGLNNLLNLVSSIGTFRLAVSAAFFGPDKGTTARTYRAMLPNDPWGPLVEEVYSLCRVRCSGKLPATAADLEALIRCIDRIPEFENSFVVQMLQEMPRLLEHRDSESRWTALATLRGLEGRSEPDVQRIEEIRELCN